MAPDSGEECGACGAGFFFHMFVVERTMQSMNVKETRRKMIKHVSYPFLSYMESSFDIALHMLINK